MSIYAIGLLAIIFLFLNLLLVNVERVAFKIRDYGYSHFHLGQAHASASSNLRLANTNANANANVHRHVPRQTRPIVGGSKREQCGGYREVVVVSAEATINGIKESLAGQVKNAITSNKRVANMISPDMLDKLTKVLISDLLFLLEKNKVPIDKLKDEFDLERLKEKVTDLLETSEFRELKSEFNKLMTDPNYNQLINGLYENLSSTQIARLADQTMARESENLDTLEKNIRVNLNKDLEGIEVKDQSPELAKFLGFDLLNNPIMGGPPMGGPSMEDDRPRIKGPRRPPRSPAPGEKMVKSGESPEWDDPDFT